MKVHEMLQGEPKKEEDMVAADVTVTPGAKLPGTDQLQTLINGLGTWALMAALVGMLLGAALWPLGHHSSNYQQAANRRKGLLFAAFAALIVPAAPPLLHSF